MVDRRLAGMHYDLRGWAMQRAAVVVVLVYIVAPLVVLLTLPKEYSA